MQRTALATDRPILREPPRAAVPTTVRAVPQDRRSTPAERVLALSRALLDPNTEGSRRIVRREIGRSIPLSGPLAFVRREWRRDRPVTLLSATLAGGLIKRANELVGQSMVDAGLLPRLALAYEAAAEELRRSGLDVRVIRASYAGAELGATGPLDHDALGRAHATIERWARQTLDGFHIALDIQLADMPYALTVGAAPVESPTFASMLRAHMRSGGAAKAARVTGGFGFHSSELIAEILGNYRRWVEGHRGRRIAGMPALTIDPLTGRHRVNLDLLASDRAGALIRSSSEQLAPVRSALNVIDWVHYERSDRLLEEADRTKRALDWIERLREPVALSDENQDALEDFVMSVHPRLAFVRTATRGPSTVFAVDMRNLGPRGMSICERLVGTLLDRSSLTESTIDEARVHQNDLIQDLKQILQVAVDVVRTKVGPDAQVFSSRGGDDVIIGVRTKAGPLDDHLRLEVAAALSGLPGVRCGAATVTGSASTLDEEVGVLEQRMSDTLKRIERSNRPGRFFLDGDRTIAVAV